MSKKVKKSATRTDADISRRSFIKGTALAAGGAVAGGTLLAGGAVALSGDANLERPYPQVKGNLVELPDNGKEVVIVGGGLAGLQAGVELSARGFRVTVLERSGSPGGKCKSWRDKRFGPANDPAKQEPDFPGYIREHGTHAVWGFYNNLREFMGRYGWNLKTMPDGISMYTFLDKNGDVSYLKPAHWANPLDKIQLLMDARNMGHIPQEERNDFIRMAMRLLTFDYADPQQRTYMDSMTFAEYGQKMGLSERMIHTICDSLLEMAYFDNVTHASALTLANLFQLISGDGKDLDINLYDHPVSETFLQRMVDYIRAHNGRVIYNVDISGFEEENGVIARVVAAPLPDSPRRIRRCAVCGNLVVDGMEIDGECPFCGASTDMLQDITDDAKTERSWTADYFISAVDIPGAQTLVSRNRNVFKGEYFDNIMALGTQSVYVCNLWFEGRGYWEQQVKDYAGRAGMCFFATGFDYLGITINRALNLKLPDMNFNMAPEFANRDITVIETQIANAQRVTGLPTDEIIERVYQELKSVMPDLPRPVSRYVNRWHNYNGYKPGTENKRPAIQSPINNLLFIGDMAFVPHPGVFMEKTNVTAKTATNLLLTKAGIKEGHIDILVSGTPSAAITALRKMTSVIL